MILAAYSDMEKTLNEKLGTLEALALESQGLKERFFKSKSLKNMAKMEARQLEISAEIDALGLA